MLAAVKPEQAYFWATHSGAELDLFFVSRGRRYGVELKFQDAPRLTPSMRTAMKDLRLDHLAVLYPGSRAYSLAPSVAVVPLECLSGGDGREVLGRSAR